MLLMGWRELELLERLQFITVQEFRQGEVGYFLSQDMEHIKLNKS